MVRMQGGLRVKSGGRSGGPVRRLQVSYLRRARRRLNIMGRLQRGVFQLGRAVPSARRCHRLLRGIFPRFKRGYQVRCSHYEGSDRIGRRGVSCKFFKGDRFGGIGFVAGSFRPHDGIITKLSFCLY